MIDKKARDKFAELFRHLVAGQITNHEFESRIPLSSEDRAIREIWISAWSLYSTYEEYTLTGKYRVPDEDRQEVAKWVLFLKTDQEYQWPRGSLLKEIVMDLRWLVSLGCVGYSFKDLLDTAGDLDVWPFFCQKDLEAARRKPPYLVGAVREEQSMNAELYARVKAFVAEQTGISAKKLTPDKRLEDLGIGGDDGYELLEAFCEEFEIRNMSEIDPSEYFGPEECNPFVILFVPFGLLIWFYYLVFDREKLRDPDPSLTLRDLVKSAEAKKWIPPEAK